MVFPSSDGEVEFAKEEQDPDAKCGEGPQPPCIRDDPSNQGIHPFGSGVSDSVLQIVQQSLEAVLPYYFHAEEHRCYQGVE